MAGRPSLPIAELLELELGGANPTSIALVDAPKPTIAR